MSEVSRRMRTRRRVDRLTKSVESMTCEERKQAAREAREWLSRHAPTEAASKSDLLRFLMVIGGEFIKRYYPDASFATFHVSEGDRGDDDYRYSVITIPVARSQT